jgi:hypothetical protein
MNMRKSFLFTITLLALSFMLAACSSAAANRPDAQPVNIQVASDPNPAAMGDVTLTLLITDSQGRPLEGGRVDVSVDHTDMTGMTMSGPATEQSPGRYAIRTNFSMSGNWKMTVYVRKDGLDYKEDIRLQIK